MHLNLGDYGSYLLDLWQIFAGSANLIIYIIHRSMILIKFLPCLLSLSLSLFWCT